MALLSASFNPNDTNNFYRVSGPLNLAGVLTKLISYAFKFMERSMKSGSVHDKLCTHIELVHSFHSLFSALVVMDPFQFLHFFFG